MHQQAWDRLCKIKDGILILKFLNGNLVGVMESIIIMLKRFHEFENVSKHYADDVVKLLIPNTFVTKLIGASIRIL